MNLEKYKADLRTRFPNASEAFIEINSQVQAAVAQSDEKKSLGRPVSRKEESVGCITLSYRAFLVRPQDPDNLVGGTKDCTDGLRRCGLIHGDDPTQIRLIVEQEKVKTLAEERLEIEITYP